MDIGYRGFSVSHRDFEQITAKINNINTTLEEINSKIADKPTDESFSAKDAKANQVPTADGNGGWAWKDTQTTTSGGDSSGSTDTGTTGGTYIINRSTVSEYYGESSEKTNEQKKHCEELKAALLSGITIRILGKDSSEYEVYYSISQYSVKKNSSGYPMIVLCYYDYDLSFYDRVDVYLEEESA